MRRLRAEQVYRDFFVRIDKRSFIHFILTGAQVAARIARQTAAAAALVISSAGSNELRIITLKYTPPS